MPTLFGLAAVGGITGATAASRYVGATASGAPVSGTFAIGDYIIDRAGRTHVCTAAGTPGTWLATDSTKVTSLGLAGGQTVIGGTGSGDDLTLQSTSNATRGSIFFEGEAELRPTDATFTTAPKWIYTDNAYTLDLVNANTYLIQTAGSVLYNQSGWAGGAYSAVRNGTTFKNVNAVVANLGTHYLFNNAGTYQADGATITNILNVALQDTPTFNVINSGVLTITDRDTVRSQATVNTGATITTRRGLYMADATGTGVVTNQIGVDIPALTKGATLNASLVSAGAAVQLRHLGPAVFGANAAPTNTTSVGLEVQSTTRAFLASRMTTTQRDALTAVDGMAVYNSTTATLQGRESGVWQSYAAIDGRAGGQTVIGGTGSGDNLTLNTTSHATKGAIKFAGGAFWYDQTSGRLSLNILGVGDAMLHVLSGGSTTPVQLLSTATTNDDPTEEVIQDRVATTDATVTTIHTFGIPASTTVGISAWVVARRTGGVSGTAEDGAYYRKAACFKNVAGVATQIGTTSDMGTDHESQAGWNVTFAVSGANALLQVTGASQNNVTWHMTARQHYLST